MNLKRLDYIKKHGMKNAIISEFYKESEMQGNNIFEIQAELIKSQFVKPRMLSDYTRTYEENRNTIDWVK